MFKNVSFKYPESDKYALKNVSFQIRAGQKIAIVGASGCGKTTIFKLLMRYYDVDEGEILIDGKNIKNCNIEWQRLIIGYVPQDVPLFDGTIAENIRYKYKNATEDDIREAARIANALEFIERNEFHFLNDDRDGWRKINEDPI